MLVGLPINIEKFFSHFLAFASELLDASKKLKAEKQQFLQEKNELLEKSQQLEDLKKTFKEQQQQLFLQQSMESSSQEELSRIRQQYETTQKGSEQISKFLISHLSLLNQTPQIPKL